MAQHVGKFTIHIEQVEGFQFRTRFDKEQYADLLMDEPAPLGRDSAPNPARILAAAIGDCLSASLLFCMKRAGLSILGIVAKVDVELVRNENKRLRIGAVDVALTPRLAGDADAERACLEAFEDFCVVTQSVREGLDVRVNVSPERTLATG
jgi:uncharacterized OsmC-like protein